MGCKEKSREKLDHVVGGKLGLQHPAKCGVVLAGFDLCLWRAWRHVILSIVKKVSMEVP